MSVFSNSFFSLSGQKERLVNVGKVLTATVQGIVGKGPGLTANPSNVPGLTTAGKVAATVANTPGGVLVAAAALTPALPTALPGVGTAPTAIRAAITSSVAKLPTKAKVGAVVLAPAAVTFAANAPEKTASALVSAPGKLASFGGDLGRFVEDPSVQNAKKLITENKAVLVAGGVVAAALAAPVAVSASSAFTASKQASASAALGTAISDVAKAGAAAPAIPAGFGKGDTNGKVPLESTAEIVPGSPTGATVPVATAAKAAQTTKKYKRKSNGGRLDVHLKIPGLNSGRGRSAYSRNVRLGLAYAQKERLFKAA